jgi:hypothetical protein
MTGSVLLQPMTDRVKHRLEHFVKATNEEIGPIASKVPRADLLKGSILGSRTFLIETKKK